MNYEELNNKLKQIKIEDYIWVIYIGIIVLSWYANDLERIYLIKNNIVAKEKYQTLMIIIFFVLLIIYLYFLKLSIDEINKLKDSDSDKKKRLAYLSFIATLFITISGLIFFIIAIVDKDLDVELAFN